MEAPEEVSHAMLRMAMLKPRLEKQRESAIQDPACFGAWQADWPKSPRMRWTTHGDEAARKRSRQRSTVGVGLAWHATHLPNSERRIRRVPQNISTLGIKSGTLMTSQ
jgi:hypothetical protein